jgi:FSR family fosmidomycin resistance protein-like MFS transporter
MLGSGLLTLGSTMYHPPSLKLSSTVDPSKISNAMGAHLAGGSLGIAMGPISLGLLMPRFGWRFTFYLWIPLTILISIFTYNFINKFIKESSKKTEIKTDLFTGIRKLYTKKFILVLTASCIVEVVIVNVSGFTPTYFQSAVGMSESLSSFIFGLGPVAGIAGAFIGGSEGDRFGIYKSAIANLIIICFLLSLIPFASNLIGISVTYILYTGMVFATMPLINSMIAFNSDINNRSLAFSLYFMIASIIGAFFPIITSLMAEIYGIIILYPMSYILLIPSIILILYLNKTK